MILVDTSVWIDFFGGRELTEVDELVRLIGAGEEIVFTGVILQELAQGCATTRELNLIENHFRPFGEIFVQRSTYLLAAKLFRDCRKKGFTIRSSIDCLIAACAIESECSMLHNYRDYGFIAKVSALRIHHV